MNVYANEICRDVDKPRSIDVDTQLLYDTYEKENVSSVSRFKSDHVLKLLRATLKRDQQLAFDQVTRAADGPQVFTIDAGPGTGKSFLVNVIMKSLAAPPRYLVYSHNLLQLVKPFMIEAQTACGFLCRQLGRTFFETKRMFQGDEAKVLANVDLCIRSYHVSQPTIVVDEYSVLSPWFLVTLIVYSQRAGKLLLLVGDSFQQRSLQCHGALRASNFELLKACTKLLKLEENIRQQHDPQLQTFITKIRGWVDHGHVAQDQGLELARMFADKLNVVDDWSLPYLAQFHVRIKERTRDLCSSRAHFKSYYVTASGDRLETNKKFEAYVPLIVGQLYVHTHRSIKKFVHLVSFTNNQAVVQTLDGFKFTVSKTPCSSTNTTLALLEYVHGHLQFPLQLPFFTFHSVQGLTLDFKLVDIDARTRSANSLYVGFSRLQRSSQLHKVYLDPGFWPATRNEKANAHIAHEHKLITVAQQLLHDPKKFASGQVLEPV